MSASPMHETKPLVIVDGNCQGHELAAILAGSGLAECHVIDPDYGFVPFFRGVGASFVTPAYANEAMARARAAGRRTVTVSQATQLRSDYAMPYSSDADVSVRFPHLQCYALVPHQFRATYRTELPPRKILDLDLRAISVASARAACATDFAEIIRAELPQAPRFHTEVHPDGRLTSLVFDHVAAAASLGDADERRQIAAELAASEGVNFITMHPIAPELLGELGLQWPSSYEHYREMLVLTHAARWRDLAARVEAFATLFVGDSQCWLALARLALALGHAPLGELAFATLLRLSPGYIGNWHLYFEFVVAHRGPDALDGAMREASEVLHRQRILHKLLAEAEFRRRRAEPAEAHARTYFDAFPYWYDAAMPLLTIYAASGRRDDARAIALESARLLPKSECERLIAWMRTLPQVDVDEAAMRDAAGVTM